MDAACQPFQCALGTRAGTDLAAHLIRVLLDMDSDLVVTAVDEIGASDNVKRASIFRRLSELPCAAGLELFVYHEDDEYDDGEVLGTNYWKYFSSLHHYSHFGIMSILTVTQILSMVGIAGEINIMAW